MSEVAYIGPGRRARPLLRTLVGDVLRRLRLEQGRTLADVARDARVSVPYLSEVERGRKEASSEVLAAVCDALRVELSDVLAEVGRDLEAVRAPVLHLDPARLDPARRDAARFDAARLDAPRLGAARFSARQRHRISPPAPRRSGDAVLLAA